MPLYSYRCKHCGDRKELIQGMHDEHTAQCDCGEPMVRDFNAGAFVPLNTEKGDTFWSQSMAISPSQAAEHRRRFPNVRIREDGCLGFDSVKERSDYCEATGFYKVPGKKKRRVKKVPVKKSPSTPA